MNTIFKHSNGTAVHHSGNEDNSSLKTIVIINCVLNAPLMLISILGNALVLVAIIRNPSSRSTSIILLCSLAFSDLLVGLVAQPIYTALQLTQDQSVRHVWRMIGASLCGVSLLTITAITVDRFLALHYHMRYATLVTESRIKYTSVIIWLICFLISNFQFWSLRVQSFLVGLLTIICIVISTFCYIKIYLIVRRHQLHIHAQQQALQSSNGENNLNMMRLKKSAVNTLVFYIALVTCYLPEYVISTIHGISDKNWQPEWDFALTAVFVNSSLNPFLYCWRLRELRTAVVKTAKQMLCKQTEEN
ncbi:histamine H2 receptor-like [Oculina patagonica]